MRHAYHGDQPRPIPARRLQGNAALALVNDPEVRSRAFDRAHAFVAGGPLGTSQAKIGLKPNAAFLHQRNQGNWHVEELSRQPHKFVEYRIRGIAEY